MKLLFLVLLLNLAYAQSNEQTEQQPQKQESQPVEGSIENPFNFGPYKGNDYVPFDRLRMEKAESKEDREEEESEQSQF